MTTQRLLIAHTTGYRYEHRVTVSYNEARMTPMTTTRQALLDETIEVTPVTWRHRFTDYWGTLVTAFDVLTPHTEMTVVSRATVEVFAGSEPEATATWDDLRSEGVRDTHHEVLVQSPLCQPPPEVVELARTAAGDLPPDGAARAVCEALIAPLTYAGGVTSVRTPATEVWAARGGVCQDFAHLTLGALRSLGIPARYVSGYLHPDPDQPLRQSVEAESHAWIEWWAGDWFAYDPTHAGPVATDHVVVARGRDYGDVPPLKGVYAGTAGSQLFVNVEITRLL
jgi:transglutaminase-like putative cysteine protease